MTPCPLCDGTGKQHYLRPRDPKKARAFTPPRCYVCNGTGERPASHIEYDRRLGK